MLATKKGKSKEKLTLQDLRDLMGMHRPTYTTSKGKVRSKQVTVIR